MHPVPYPITTPFGVPGSWAAGQHTGDDYACPAGTPVVACVAGTVVACAWDDSYGWYVELETDGIRHRYCHLSSEPTVGGQVAEGQQVGVSGSTGNSTGPHVHLEERVAPWSYWDHRRPEFNQQGAQQPAPDDDEEVDDMVMVEAPERGVGLAGAGYFKVLTEEERDTMLRNGIKLIKGNARQFDVTRAACVQGED